MPASQKGPDRAEVETAYKERLHLLKQLACNMEEAIAAQLADVPHVDRICFRAKTISSFVEKVFDRKTDPPYGDPLIEVEDQVAGRVLVFFADDVDTAREAVERLITPVEAQHRKPERSNEFDYESFHGVYSFPPQLLPPDWETLVAGPETFELQIRTLFQHAYAEPQHDVAYKAKIPLDSADKRELAWIAASAWGSDQAMMRVRERLARRALEADTTPN